MTIMANTDWKLAFERMFLLLLELNIYVVEEFNKTKKYYVEEKN